MTAQKIPGLDTFQERQFNNLRQRHIGAAIKNATEIWQYAAIVLDRLNNGQRLGSLNAQTILKDAAELAQRLAILEELDEVAGILDAGTVSQAADPLAPERSASAERAAKAGS
jgi:hypothetical protein